MLDNLQKKKNCIIPTGHSSAFERCLSLFFVVVFFSDNIEFIAQPQTYRESSCLFTLVIDPTTLDQRAALLLHSGT